MRPASFKGGSSDDARRFLAGFTMWAMTQGTGLNVVDQQGNAVGRRNCEWIRAALSFLEGEAAVWASPAMESFARGVIPFQDDWDRFHADFKARFETVDEAADAKEKLRTLYQGFSSVPEYAAKFKELMARTLYSQADLRDRFYDHLSPRIKDELVHTDREHDTFDRLVNVATDIDTRIRLRRAEREKERPRAGTSTGATTARFPAPTPTFTTVPSSDPNIMDVDATRTREEYLKRMRGRCFGCGSPNHNKRDGNHERDLCRHCKRTGHREAVCMDKFTGRSQAQKVAATEDESFSLDDCYLERSSVDSSEVDWEEESLALDGDIAELAATSSAAVSGPRVTLAQLQEQQKALAELIAAFRDQDF
jgi:hypothetical protein